MHTLLTLVVSVKEAFWVWAPCSLPFVLEENAQDSGRPLKASKERGLVGVSFHVGSIKLLSRYIWFVFGSSCVEPNYTCFVFLDSHSA
jgi:hypothetical protein